MPSSHNQPNSVAIVGGGVLGLRLAQRAREAGHSVVLFEAAPFLGGLAASWSIGGATWDRHYHVTLLSDSWTRSLIGELGLEDECRWVESKTGFYTDGRLYSLSNSLEFLRFPPLDLLHKFRLGATIVRASRIRDWRSLEGIPAIEWLEKWSGRKTVDRIWRPLLRAKLGDLYDRASAAFIWAIIARMYSARRSGLKREMFGYVRGGYARILAEYESRIRELDVEIELGQRVAEVSPSDGGRVTVRTEDGDTRVFDHVVVTAAAPLAALMCADLDPAELGRLEAISYQGVVCASVLLRKSLGGYYVTNITDERVPFTGVIEMTSLVDREEVGGHHLVYLPKYVPPDDPLFSREDGEIREFFLAELLRMYSHLEPDDVVDFRVSRVRHVLAVPTVGYSELLQPFETSVPGLSLVNTSQIVNGTLNVNETLQLAERAAARLFSQVEESAAA